MKIRTAVFPAAGLGTRFLPATKVMPKEMLPLVDKPIIQHVVEEARAAGLERLVLVTSRGKQLVEDHFDVSFELETMLERRGKKDLADVATSVSAMASIISVRQKVPLGLGHAVLQARDLAAGEPIAVILPDDVVVAEEPCIAQLMRVANERGGSVLAVMEVAADRVSQYGIVAGEGTDQPVFEVTDLVEKPDPGVAPSRLAIVGRYVLGPEIFPILERTAADARGEIQITDAIRTLRQHEPVWACRFSGRRFDAGDKLGFLQATVALALARDDLGPPFRDYLRALKL